MLKYATAQPICRIEDDDKSNYFFFALPGIEPEYAFDRSTAKDIRVLNGKVTMEVSRACITHLIPGTECVTELQSSSGKKIRIVKRQRKDVKIKVIELGWRFGFPEWSIWIPKDAMEGLNDVLLRIHYSGDSAEAYLNRSWFRKEQHTVSDNFYNGLPWEIGLKRFVPQVLGSKLEIRIVPLYEHAAIYLEKWPEFKNGMAAKIHKVEAAPEYKATITESRRGDRKLEP